MVPRYDVKNATLLSNANIISANNQDIHRYVGFVLIENGRILYADRQKPRLRGAYKDIDVEGKFVIPGLIDSHVHLANISGFNGTLKNKYPNLLKTYLDQLPRSYLYYGFTTLIDLNNYYPELVKETQNSLLSPDIFTCGRQVLIMDDFNMEMEEYPTEQRYSFPFLHDKANSEITYPEYVDLNQHTAEKLVSKIIADGGICVKFAYEDAASGLRVSWAKPSLQVMRELAFAAENQNIPLILHAPSLEGHIQGMAAGIDIFGHGMWNWTDNFEEEFNNLELSSAHIEVLNQIVDKQVGYQLTFRTITGEQDLIEGKFLADLNLENVYPKDYLELLRSEEGKWGREKILRRGPFLKQNNPSFYNAMRGSHKSEEEMWERTYVLYKTRLETTAKFLSDNKAKFLLGSDTPAMNMATNPPGYNGFLEMKHMFQAGITLESIFKAATINNAMVFHMENEIGSVDAGKKANLLVLNSNPLDTIEAYDDIDLIFIAGTPIQRESLSAKAKF